MKTNNKQRLFEVMQKVDKTFKSKLNEDFNNNTQQYQIEFDNLKKEYGDNVINNFFTSGLPGYIDSRTRGNYSLDAIKQNLNHLKVNEELAVASDGGYYERPEYPIVVSREEAAEIKQITDSMARDLFSKEGITKVGPNDKLKYHIIQELKDNGIEMDYDDESGDYYFWIAKSEDVQLAKEELRLIVANLYDKVEDNVQNKVMTEAQQGINPKYTHFAVTKDDNKIVNGWEYGDIEPAELRQFKKDYFFNDLSEMGIDPRNINVVTAKYLQKSGINPLDTANWKQSTNESAVVENRGGFKRLVIFNIYDKNGSYLGDLDSIDERSREGEFYEGTKTEVLRTPEFQKFAQSKNITPEQVGQVKREYEYSMDGNILDTEYYAPSQSQELYDPKTNTWYNLSGQQMRDPSEYDRGGEGYTPFGDEGEDY